MVRYCRIFRVTKLKTANRRLGLSHFYIFFFVKKKTASGFYPTLPNSICNNIFKCKRTPPSVLQGTNNKQSKGAR